jgi:trigger factor
VKTDVKPSAENEVVLTVEVPAESVKKMYERTLSRLQRETNMPGFRKGHVPRQLVLQRLGEDYVRAEAVQDALPEWYDEAISGADVRAVSMPDLVVDPTTFDPQQDFSFAATVQVKPTPELGQYKGLEVPRRELQVTDEQIDAQLAMLQERMASLKPVEDRGVKQGDFVLLDLEGSSEGEPIEGAAASDYMTEVGRGNLIPGFEEALEGVVRDEEKIFDVTFPDDYHAEDLQGKPATFKVKVKEIKEKAVPELDDAFAADVSEFETMDELRADVRTRLQASADANVEHEFRTAAVDKAVEMATLTVPPAMVDREAHHLFHDLESRVEERSMSMEIYLQVIDKTSEEVEQELRPQAEQVVKRRLVLEAIAAAEGLEVTEDDMIEQINQDAEALGRDPLQVLADVRESGRADVVRDEMLLARAVALVAKEAVAVPFTEPEDEPGDETGDEAEAGPDEADAAGSGDEVSPAAEADDETVQSGAGPGDTPAQD